MARVIVTVPADDLTGKSGDGISALSFRSDRVSPAAERTERLVARGPSAPRPSVRPAAVRQGVGRRT